MDLCLLGADPDSGDLGVDALVRTVAAAVARTRPQDRLLIIGGTGGRRRRVLTTGAGDVDVTLAGASPGRGPWRSDSLARVGWGVRTRGALSGTARDLLRSPVVLDAGQMALQAPPIPGDLHAVTALRRLALRAGRPLVLLPQPHGPFTDPGLRDAARQVVAGATQVWASDDASVHVLADLLGDARGVPDVRRGVDPRFALTPREPARHVRDLVLSRQADAGRLVSLQIDGRAWAAGSSGSATASDRAYRDVVRGLTERLLADEKTHVLLIPQVLGSTSNDNADTHAHAGLHDALSPRQAARTTVLPVGVDAAETAWCIARTEWFAGTGAWSLVAALSTQTPAAALGTGPAVRAVMAAAGLAHEVATDDGSDPSAVAERLAQRAAARESVTPALAETVPALRRRAEEEMAQALAAV